MINDNGQDAIHAGRNMANCLCSASCFPPFDMSRIKKTMRVLSSTNATRSLDDGANGRASTGYVTQKSNNTELIGG